MALEPEHFGIDLRHEDEFLRNTTRCFKIGLISLCHSPIISFSLTASRNKHASSAHCFDYEPCEIYRFGWNQQATHQDEN